jgi:hypothetical protein
MTAFVAATHHPLGAAALAARTGIARDAVSPPRPRRPWAALINALLDLAGPEAAFLAHGERPWASATFSGSRHAVTLAFAGARGVIAGEAFAEALAEHEFAIPRQIVADACVTGMLHEVEAQERLVVDVELLLVEER